MVIGVGDGDCCTAPRLHGSTAPLLSLGTGSTAAFFVSEIGALLSAGKLGGIVGVPTSKHTFKLAKSLGIPLSTLDEPPQLDLAIYGADEFSFLSRPDAKRMGLLPSVNY